MQQLEAEQLFISATEDSNSIAIIIKHLWGNMLSRWTDFLTTDGEKPWRNRDAEFEDNSMNKELLLAKWDEAWACLFRALNSIESEQLSQIIYIRNEGHTIIEAINRQLAHYPYHIGQMVYAAKLLKKSNWDSLSIPKNNSKPYNDQKFAEDKTIKNFTVGELDRLK